MKQLKSSDDIYQAVGELAASMKAGEFSRYGDVLDHRLRTVAWTSRSELFEELERVLNEMLGREERLPVDLKGRVTQIVSALREMANDV